MVVGYDAFKAHLAQAALLSADAGASLHSLLRV